jgi:hypothetical protein
MEVCMAWQLRPVAGSFERYVANVERVASDGRPGGATCALLGARAGVEMLKGREELAPLVTRLERVVTCAARTGGNASPVAQATRPQSAEQAGFDMTQRQALDSQLHIETPRQARQLSLRTGDDSQDSPDDAATLRRQAKSYLARHEAGKAVAVLARAVRILDLAFGEKDGQYVAALAELERAKKLAIEQARPFPPKCQAELGAVPLSEPALLAELRDAYALERAGLPVPPSVYGAACRALSGDLAFAQEEWSDPVVTTPLLEAARASLSVIPREAAQLHVTRLLARAAQLGLGPSPEFALGCPAALLDMASALAKQHGLPRPDVKGALERLSRGRACARSAPQQTTSASQLRPQQRSPASGKTPKRSPP